MLANASYLKRTHPYPILRGNSFKVLRNPVKIYGKGAGSQLPVFTVKSTGIFSVRNM